MPEASLSVGSLLVVGTSSASGPCSSYSAAGASVSAKPPASTAGASVSAKPPASTVPSPSAPAVFGFLGRRDFARRLILCCL